LFAIKRQIEASIVHYVTGTLSIINAGVEHKIGRAKRAQSTEAMMPSRPRKFLQQRFVLQKKS
jgi:hypothetical protein